jgi:DNA-binding LacI/PurR family transcriptional regulator
MLANLSPIPVVAASDDPLWSRCDRVISDHEAGAFALTSWLLEQGKRRILRIWPEQKSVPYWLQARNKGFERALATAGLQPMPAMFAPPSRAVLGLVEDEDRAVFSSDVRLLGGYLIEYLSGSNPKIDAIMAASDSASYLASAACRLFGLEPNKDVWVVGYDNFWEEERVRRFEPSAPIATVEKKNHLIGQSMVDLLRERIAGQLPVEPQRRVMQPELVVLDRAPALATV